MNRIALFAMVILAVVVIAPSSIARATDEQSMAQELADKLQEVAVRTKLVEELGVDALRVSVTVSGKTVYLAGSVPKAAIRNLAPDIALRVKGITIVKNDIDVVEGPGTMERAESEAKDTALALKVKSVLLAELGRNALDINVDADGGIVTLRGKVDSAQISQLAFAESSKVKGVRMVVNTLTH